MSDASEVIEMVGTVAHLDIEIEGGCTVLRAGGETYDLTLDDRASRYVGVRVRVRGRILPDVVTVCQVGPVFEVHTIAPAPGS